MRISFELFVDILYLLFVAVLGGVMVKKSAGKKQYLLFGTMAIALSIGDTFLLIPKLIVLTDSTSQLWTVIADVGQQIALIAITLFYVLLYYVWRNRYKIREKKGITETVWTLAIFRMILSFFLILLYILPNEWINGVSLPRAWERYLSIPFLIMGLLIVILFNKSAKENDDRPFRWLWLMIGINLICYILIDMLVQSIPLMIVLMILLMGMYILLLMTGYHAMEVQIRNEKKG